MTAAFFFNMGNVDVIQNKRCIFESNVPYHIYFVYGAGMQIVLLAFFFFHILRCFVKKTKNLSEQTPCWADCQENTIPSSFAIRGINNLKKLLKLMVLLVYPLKDLIPNSTAILSYKFIMKQFSFRVCHHVKHQFKHS